MDTLFDDEDIFKDEPIQPVNTNDEPLDNLFSNDTNENDFLINSILKGNGISNPDEIIMVDEAGKESTVKFSDLSKEEKLQILSTKEPQVINSEPSEVDKFLNENNLTFEDFLEQYKQQVLAESQIQNYTIDNYSDEELFLADLKDKYDLTDEELHSELEKEQQNPDLFKKKVDKLRDEYKASEDAYREQQNSEYEAENQRKYDEFSQQMLEVAENTTDLFDTIELADDEKESVLASLLDLDENGTSEFGRSLNDPQKLYQVAWFLKYGQEAFDAIKSYYTSEINQIKKDQGSKTVYINNTKSEGLI